MDKHASQNCGRPLLPLSVNIARRIGTIASKNKALVYDLLVQGFLAGQWHDCGRSQEPRRSRSAHIECSTLGLRDDPSSHVHMIVRWWEIARRHALDWLPSKLLLHGEVLSRLFRRLMLACDRRNTIPALIFGGPRPPPARPRSRLSRTADSTKWFVYSKSTFAGPEQGLA